MWGTVLLKNGFYTDRTAPLKVDCITFSVLPTLTMLWSKFILRAIEAQPRRVIIGDSSGALRHIPRQEGVSIVPIMNYPHGEKLDLFMRHVCRAEYVVVSDDDVFWLDEQPWLWAMQQFEQHADTAVVSLCPRSAKAKILEGKVPQPMGSYSLVIRRRIWAEENLSFRIRAPIGARDHDWYYDTADWANVLLLERGYKVAIAPPDVRVHLVVLEGVSNWSLKIQKHQGHIAKLLDTPLKREKALRVTLFVKELNNLAHHCFPRSTNLPLIDPTFLQIAEGACRSMLPAKRVEEIRAQTLEALEQILQGLLW